MTTKFGEKKQEPSLYRMM